MNIDLDQLGCSYNDLVGYSQILKRLKPSHIYMLSFQGKLKLGSSNTNSGTENSNDWAQVEIPYKGKKMEGFIETSAFTEALKSQEGVLVFPNPEKRPYDWTRHIGMRVNEHVKVIGKNIQNAMEYLLQIKWSGAPDYMKGIIATPGELTATDGHRMHVDQSIPNLIHYKASEADPPRRIMGLGAASALMHAARKMPAADVSGGWQNSSGNQGFYFLFKHGKITLTITSTPVMQAIDPTTVRLPGDENNSAFTVFGDHLKSVIDHTLAELDNFNKANKKKGIKGYAVLKLEHQVDRERCPVLRATPQVHYTDTDHKDQILDRPSHDLVCNPTSGFEIGRFVSLDASYLQDAVTGLGPHIQLILPSHPVDGLRYCYVNPVYVTGKPGRFAVISPCWDSKEAKQIAESREQATKPRRALKEAVG